MPSPSEEFAPQGQQVNGRQATSRDSVRAIACFLALVLLLSWSFEFATVLLHGAWITAAMWSVGVAAILTCLLRRRPLSTLGFGWGSWRYIWIGYLIPLCYAVLSFGIAWGTGLAGFNPAAANDGMRDLGLTFLPRWAAPVIFTIVNGIVVMPAGISSSLGEELGWRGFLAPELMKLVSFTKTCFIVGIIWGLWHFPLIFLGAYNAAKGPGLTDAVLFLTATTSASIPMIYLRMRSTSVWPATVFHASHNLFVRTIFGHMITDGTSSNVAGEVGWVSLIIMVSVAAYFLWKGKKDFALMPQRR
jgi:membrane protease YdiL (CAAX protease family)